MKKIFGQNKIFLLVFGLVWIALSVLLLIFSKADIHLFINQFHNRFSNFFFEAITYLGDGLFVVFLFVVSMFISFRRSIMIGGGGLISGIIVQILKRTLFEDILRPKAYFKFIGDLYFVPGVEIHEIHSFPSGHTATAFFAFFVLAFLSKRKTFKLLCVVLSLLVGFSRIYLSQHFLVDVYFGGILGVVIAFCSVYFTDRLNGRWLDKSIISVIQRNE